MEWELRATLIRSSSSRWRLSETMGILTVDDNYLQFNAPTGLFSISKVLELVVPIATITSISKRDSSGIFNEQLVISTSDNQTITLGIETQIKPTVQDAGPFGYQIAYPSVSERDRVYEFVIERINKSKPKAPLQDITPKSALDQAIIDLISARRFDTLISYQAIHDVTEEEFSTTPDLIQLHLSRLINNGSLSGYLDDAGYHRDAVIEFTCQVCDKEIMNPQHYWQCPECYRFVCSDCHTQHPICPAHPETSSSLVEVPIVCPHCHKGITSLKAIQGYQCPNCNQPVSFA